MDVLPKKIRLPLAGVEASSIASIAVEASETNRSSLEGKWRSLTQCHKIVSLAEIPNPPLRKRSNVGSGVSIDDGRMDISGCVYALG